MAATFRSARHQRLAALLAEHREKAGLHQSQVAELLGRHQRFIANIESGERRVDVSEFLALARAIGFDPHETLEILLKSDE